MKKTVFTLVLLSALATVLWPAPPAEAIGNLTYSWSCVSRYCTFTVTSNDHEAYAWNFGDGTSSGKTTATTVYHFYNIPVDEEFHTFYVTLSGYATYGSGSPDNIIGCNISVAASSLGIGTSGSCS